MQSQRSSKLMLAAFGVLGAFAFWLPDVIVHAVRVREPRLYLLLGGLLPLSFGTVLLLGTRHRRFELVRIAFSMLAGVWVLGVPFMLLAASFSPGNHSADWGSLIALVTFPFSTYIFSAYDGSVYALIIVTVLSALGWIVRIGRQGKQAGDPANQPTR